MNRDRQGIAAEAARIICEERLTDYRAAKAKAAERLGWAARAPMPDNAEVQRAVIEYQRIFGGAEYIARLQRMREAALKAMKLLESFSPRLVGGAVSGAVTDAHRVQLHAFSDKPETLDIFLANRGVDYEQGDRSYRFADGSEESIPLVQIEFDGIGIDVAVFGEIEVRRAPLSPADGSAFKRLDVAQVQALLAH